MKINTAELKTALEIVKPGIAINEFLEQSTSFAFTQGSVVTYNSEICIKHPIQDIDFEGAVIADELYKFLTRIKKEEIELTVEGNQLVITSGRSVAKFNMQSEVLLPFSDVESTDAFEEIPSPEDFVKGVRFVAPICKKDVVQMLQDCVHITSDFVEATDNHRICNYKTSIPVKDVLVPKKNLLAVVNLNPVYVAETNEWIHFKTEAGTIISCRTVVDDFPDTSNVLNVTGTSITFPKTIDEVLSRAEVFSSGDALGGFVEITTKKNRLQVSSKSEQGEFSEEINMKYDGTPIRFIATTAFIKSVMSQVQECVVSERLIMFKAENWIYVSSLRV